MPLLCLHTQTLSGLAEEAWEEVDLTAAVPLDITKELWITVYTADGTNYPAGCGAYTGNPNGDLITIDGILWEHLNDLGLPNTWNLRGFVTNIYGETLTLTSPDKPLVYNNVGEQNQLSISNQGSGINNNLLLNSKGLWIISRFTEMKTVEVLNNSRGSFH